MSDIDLSIVADVVSGLQDVNRALHDEDGFALPDSLGQELARIAHGLETLAGPLERIASTLEKLERFPR